MCVLEKWDCFPPDRTERSEGSVGTSALAALALCQAKHVKRVFVVGVHIREHVCVYTTTAACIRPTAGETRCRAFLWTQLSEPTSVHLSPRRSICVLMVLCTCARACAYMTAGFISGQLIPPSPHNFLHSWESEDTAS